MNIFKNKYFLLGNLAFLLLAIPVVLFIVKNQTSTRGSAAPTTTLSFVSPSITVDQCDETKTSRLVLNPGENIVSTVQLALKWDKTKFDINFAPNTTAFPQTLKGPEQTTTGMSITLNIGADVTKAISTTTDLGTITIKPLAPTNGTVVALDIDAAGTKVYSLAQQDGATEDVFNAAGSSPLQVSITPQSCGDQATPSTTPTVTTTPDTTVTPTVTTAVTPTPTTIVTPTPTTSVANQSPVCLSLSASVSSGSAPLSVNFTATGNDSNGTISKATFNFGNGQQQDVTTGLGTASASAQVNYTYTSGGNFSATAVFTDNNGAVSSTCTQSIAVTGAFATLPPTATPTLAPIITDPPTPTPTIADSGSLTTTVGIIGGVILIIFAGIFLLVL